MQEYRLVRLLRCLCWSLLVEIVSGSVLGSGWDSEPLLPVISQFDLLVVGVVAVQGVFEDRRLPLGNLAVVFMFGYPVLPLLGVREAEITCQRNIDPPVYALAAAGEGAIGSRIRVWGFGAFRG